MPDGKISLANQIRDKLDAGALPRVLPEKMWTRLRSRQLLRRLRPASPPGADRVSLPLESGDVFRLHIGCLDMWLAELRRRGLVKQNGTL
jgi:hypothetical protein